MSDYKVVVVGTDGSDTSFRAVDRAAEIAAEAGAKLIVATAYLPREELHSGEPDQLKGVNYRTEGNAPVYAMLREAAEDHTLHAGTPARGRQVPRMSKNGRSQAPRSMCF